MGYNRQQLKMKKTFFLLLMVAGIGMCAHAQQSSSAENNAQGCYLAENMADECSFAVDEVEPSISGTRVTIKVTVRPTFTPDKEGEYIVVISPTGRLSNILDSQQKSVEFWYTGRSWNPNYATVNFYCSVDDNTYNQCNSNSFTVSSCHRKR